MRRAALTGLSFVAPLALAAGLGGAASAAGEAYLVPAATPVQISPAPLLDAAAPVRLAPALLLPTAAPVQIERAWLVPVVAPVRLGLAPLLPAAAPVDLGRAPLLPPADPVRLDRLAPLVVAKADLAELSGGKEPAAILALTEGTVSGNVVSAGTVTSGGINIDPNSLNFTGIGNFVFNTGQNNNLQGVLNVYVAIIPSTL